MGYLPSSAFAAMPELFALMPRIFLQVFVLSFFERCLFPWFLFEVH